MKLFRNIMEKISEARRNGNRAGVGESSEFSN